MMYLVINNIVDYQVNFLLLIRVQVKVSYFNVFSKQSGIY